MSRVATFTIRALSVMAPLLFAFGIGCDSRRDRRVEETSQSTNALTRLAVVGFVSPGGASTARHNHDALADLLTSRLTGVAGLELVERREIRRVLDEAVLSSGRMDSVPGAIRTGRLLRADWLLLGSEVRADGTNSLLARIVDARTGVVRDLTCLPWAATNLVEMAEAVARFVESSKQSVSALRDRTFLAIGSFQDLSVNDRYPNFGLELNSALLRHHRGTKIFVVERTMMTPLLEELRMARSGLSEQTGAVGATNGIQPAFLIIDGIYQSYQDAEEKINVVVRVHQLGERGGRLQTFTFKEPPGPGLFSNIVARTEQAVLEMPRGSISDPARREIVRRMQRASQLTGGISGAGDPNSRARRVSDAIAEYQAVLALDQDHRRAKELLAGCLLDPAVGRKDEARDLYQELIAIGANSAGVLHLREIVAQSYVGEDDWQALALLSRLEKDATNATERLRYREMMVKPLHSLYKAGRVSLTERLAFEVDRWRIALWQAEENRVEGRAINVDTQFDYFVSACAGAVRSNRVTTEFYLERTITNLQAEFPDLKPFFVASFTRWRASPFREVQSVPPEYFGPYREFLEWCRQEPDLVKPPESIYDGILLADFFHRHHRWPPDLVDEIATLLDTQGRPHLSRGSLDRLELIRGYLFRQRGKFDQAIECFTRLGDRKVPVPHFDGARGNRWETKGAEEILETRRQMGPETSTLRVPAGVAEFRLPPPVAEVGGEVTFACDGDRVWVAAGYDVYEYVKVENRLKRLMLTTRSHSPFQCAAVTRDHLWLGSVDSGLFSVEKGTQRVRHYAVADGLLMPEVKTLHPAGDRLWIGFGNVFGTAAIARRLGGLSYLDLNSGRFVGFTEELRTNFGPAVVGGPYNRFVTQLRGAPRRPVESIFAMTNDAVWVACMDRGLLRFQVRSNLWTEEPANGWISCLDANDRFLVAGTHSDRRAGVLALERQNNQWHALTSTNGLPGYSIQSVAVDGNKVWIGSRGWLAQGDLPSRRIERVAWLETVTNITELDPVQRGRVGTIQIDGPDIWISAGNQLYRFPRNSR